MPSAVISDTILEEIPLIIIGIKTIRANIPIPKMFNAIILLFFSYFSFCLISFDCSNLLIHWFVSSDLQAFFLFQMLNFSRLRTMRSIRITPPALPRLMLPDRSKTPLTFTTARIARRIPTRPSPAIIPAQ